jgi:hypothetical protein
MNRKLVLDRKNGISSDACHVSSSVYMASCSPFPVHAPAIGICVSADGDVVARWNDTVLWLKTMRGEEYVCETDAALRAAAFNRNGDQFAFVDGAHVHVLRLKDVTGWIRDEGHDHFTVDEAVECCIGFNYMSTLMVASTDEKDVVVRSLKGCFTCEQDASVCAIAFSPDGCLVAVASYTALLRIWSTLSGRMVHELQLPESPESICLSPDGMLVMCVITGTAHVWNMHTSMQLLTEYIPRISGHVFFLRDHVICLATRDGCELWRLSDGTCTQAYAGRSLLHVGSDGSHLAIVKTDGSVLIVDYSEVEKQRFLCPIGACDDATIHRLMSTDICQIIYIFELLCSAVRSRELSGPQLRSLRLDLCTLRDVSLSDVDMAAANTAKSEGMMREIATTYLKGFSWTESRYPPSKCPRQMEIEDRCHFADIFEEIRAAIHCELHNVLLCMREFE